MSNSKHFRLLLAFLLLSGCTLGTEVAAPAPGASTLAPPTGTASILDVVPTPSGLAPAGPGQISQNMAANPAPVIRLDPAIPHAGNTVTATGAGLPPGQTIEWWLLPRLAGGFKQGLPKPGDTGGLKLGVARADATGAIAFTFTFQTPTFDRNIVPRGYYELWLVYPPGNIVAPAVATWQCPPATSLSGKVYDAAGQPVTAGATVEVEVTTDEGAAIYDRTVPVVAGAYTFGDVPEPATTAITARAPGWPPRTRGDGTGSLQIKWAGYPTGPSDGNLYVTTQGNPLVYNFGGPASPADPDAPAYFLSPDLLAPDMATATLSGQVYDQTGQLVPDSAAAKIIVDANGVAGSTHFHAQVDVRAGAYTVAGVPTGIPLTVDLRVNPVYPLTDPRQDILIPPKVSGHPNTLNFGGPATPDDPDAPKHPFPSPQPEFTGPSPFTPDVRKS